MHRMERQSVKTVGDGDLVMFCTHCDDFVPFYSHNNKVRCANALKDYYRKSSVNTPTVDEEVDVSEVLSTNQLSDLWDAQQAGHCALCDNYVRLSRDGTRKNLFLVPISSASFVPGLFCWDCRTYLLNRMSNAFDDKALHVLSMSPVSPSSLRPEPAADLKNGDSNAY